MLNVIENGALKSSEVVYWTVTRPSQFLPIPTLTPQPGNCVGKEWVGFLLNNVVVSP